MRRNTLLKNESGMILVTVILLVITLSVVAIGIMSLNISQASSSKSVVDSVIAEQLATGLFYQQYQQKFDGGTATLSNTVVITTPDGDRTYTITRGETQGSASTPNSTNQLQINVTYQ